MHTSSEKLYQGTKSCFYYDIDRYLLWNTFERFRSIVFYYDVSEFDALNNVICFENAVLYLE